MSAKTTDNPIKDANTALSHAKQALADALAQRERLGAKLRLAEADVVHEERNAGIAVDRVLVGEATDAKREAQLLADARATVDAVRQGGKRIDQQISDAQAAVAQAERAVVYTIAQEAARRSLEAVPALVDAVHALGAAFLAVRDPHGEAAQALARMNPGQAVMVPDLPLLRYLGAALQREGIDVDRFENTSHTDLAFELAVPIGQVNANLVGIIDRLREKSERAAQAA